MIYTVCILSYAAFSVNKPAKVRIAIALALTAMALFITVCIHPEEQLDGWVSSLPIATAFY